MSRSLVRVLLSALLVCAAAWSSGAVVSAADCGGAAAAPVPTLSTIEAAPTLDATALAPGVYAGLNAGGVSKFAKKIIPAALDILRKTVFEDISGTESGFDYSLEKIKINGFSVGAVSAKAATAIELAVADVSLKATANWSYRLTIVPHVPYGSGTAAISLSGAMLSLKAAITTTETSQGTRPRVRVSSVVVDLDKIDIKTSESVFSWLYNLLIAAFKGPIRRLAESKLKATIESVVNDSSDAIIATLPLRAAIGTMATVDYSLVSGAQYVSNHVVMPFNGEVYPFSTNKTDGATARVAPTFKATSKLLSIAVSTFVPQSALHVVYKSGKFNIVMTEESHPSIFPIPFTTDKWTYVPELNKKYPKAPIRLTTKFANEPKLSAGTSLTLSGGVATDVEVKVGGKWVLAFKMTGSVNAGCNVSFDTSDPQDPLLMLKFKDFKPTFTVTDSSIGSVDITKVSTVVTALIDTLILPWINNVFASGLPMPSVMGMHLSNSGVSVVSTGLQIETDIDYTPPAGFFEAIAASANMYLGY